jgi:hypothetical protein
MVATVKPPRIGIKRQAVRISNTMEAAQLLGSILVILFLKILVCTLKQTQEKNIQNTIKQIAIAILVDIIASLGLFRYINGVVSIR